MSVSALQLSDGSDPSHDVLHPPPIRLGARRCSHACLQAMAATFGISRNNKVPEAYIVQLSDS